MSNITHTLLRGSGKGKTACIIQTKCNVSLKQNTIRTMAIHHSYLFLTKFVQYDKVYIVSINYEENTPVKNLLKDDNVISGIRKHGFLLDLKIDDVFMYQAHPNFYGGTTESYTLYNLCRIAEWYEQPTHGNLYVIQDDPLFPNFDIPELVMKRLFDVGNLKIHTNKLDDEKSIEEEKELLRKYRPLLADAIKHTIVAFCGINYPRYVQKMGVSFDNDWEPYFCYIWQGMNDNLDAKLKDRPWEEKIYDAEYHGVGKSMARKKVTDDFYINLPNKFLFIGGRKGDIWINAKNFDKQIDVPYYELLDEVSKGKGCLVTHDPMIIGNQISPRFFDCSLGDIVAFIHTPYDPEKRLVNGYKELEDFIYVDKPEQFVERIAKLASDEKFYRHIKYLQRKATYEKFQKFLDADAKAKFEKYLEDHKEYT